MVHRFRRSPGCKGGGCYTAATSEQSWGRGSFLNSGKPGQKKNKNPHKKNRRGGGGPRTVCPKGDPHVATRGSLNVEYWGGGAGQTKYTSPIWQQLRTRDKRGEKGLNVANWSTRVCVLWVTPGEKKGMSAGGQGIRWTKKLKKEYREREKKNPQVWGGGAPDVMWAPKTRRGKKGGVTQKVGPHGLKKGEKIQLNKGCRLLHASTCSEVPCPWDVG